MRGPNAYFIYDPEVSKMENGSGDDDDDKSEAASSLI